MILQDSRRAARQGSNGELIALQDQDRRRWDQAAIRQGIDLLGTALRCGDPGPYQIQAAIAACHATARHVDATDWPQIAALYAQLAETAPNPVVRLNHAVAVGMADGPSAGLELLAALDASGELAGYHLLPAHSSRFSAPLRAPSGGSCSLPPGAPTRLDRCRPKISQRSHRRNDCRLAAFRWLTN